MNETDPEAPAEQGATPPEFPRRLLLQIPGVIAISLYMVLLAGVIAVGVVAGAHYPGAFSSSPRCSLLPAAGSCSYFAGPGLLALAAVFLLSVYNLWVFTKVHQPAALVQGLLNVIFFLYLIRPEVREKLR